MSVATEIQKGQTVKPSRSLFVRMASLLIILSTPLYAYADVGQTFLQKCITLATGQWAISGATLVVIFLGYRAWAGDITWRPVLGFVAGAVLIFGAAEIAGNFTSGT